MTEWIKERRSAFLTTYAALNDGKNAVDEAKQILADDPKDFTASYYTMLFTQPMYSQSQTPDILDSGEKAAKAILDNIDTPPPNVTAEQWAKLRPDVEVLAHKNLGFIGMQRKNWEVAEAELTKALTMNPNDATVDFQMATAVASEKKVDRIPIALFYFARAATYSGPGELPAAGKQAAMTYVQKQYKNFHGSDEGFNDLVALAKANPIPPGSFTLKNANELAAASAARRRHLQQDASFRSVVGQPEDGFDRLRRGAMYFEMNMKGAEIPTPLKGRVIKLEPAVKPKVILLAMEDKTNNTTTADATLKFEMPLAGKVEEGTELTFTGVADSYTASPFMVVFNVEKEKLHGWTGKNEAAPAVHHRKPVAK